MAWRALWRRRHYERGSWSISAIARHLQINRRTVRRYLSDEATVGVRRPAGPDGFEPFAGYGAAAAGRRSAPVGDGVARRAGRARLRRVVSVVDAGVAGASCARTVSRARRCKAATSGSLRTRRVRRPSSTGSSCRIRPPGGGGQDRAPARRVAGALLAVARGAGAGGGPAAPDRGPRRGGASPGRLTHRWRFDRMATVCHPDSGLADRDIRPGRGALRGRDRYLPAASGQPQGRGGEGEPDRRPALVAHPGRRAVPGRRAGQPGPVLRGSGTAERGAGRMGLAPRWPSWPPRRACGRCRPGPTRPC